MPPCQWLLDAHSSKPLEAAVLTVHRRHAHTNRAVPQEARLTLAQLYRQFTFELVPGQVPLRVKTGITMSPEHGVFVRVVPRTPAPAAAAAH